MYFRSLSFLLIWAIFALICPSHAFLASTSTCTRSNPSTITLSTLSAQVSPQEAQAGVNKVVAALRSDKRALQELGRLEQVTTILGSGQQGDTLLLRFNARFKKAGMGRSSVPLPFGLGQSTKSEGRGTMVGQVKASVVQGKVTQCSVFRDLGYGRAFELL
jgi:hypothetical protein